MVLIRLPSGLKYRVLQPPRWDAPGPRRYDTVTVWCKGWLSHNGACGANVIPGQSFSFCVCNNEVMTGLDEGVLTMRVGEQRRFFVPASLVDGMIADSIVPRTDVIIDVLLQET